MSNFSEMAYYVKQYAKLFGIDSIVVRGFGAGGCSNTCKDFTELKCIAHSHVSGSCRCGAGEKMKLICVNKRLLNLQVEKTIYSPKEVAAHEVAHFLVTPCVQVPKGMNDVVSHNQEHTDKTNQILKMNVPPYHKKRRDEFLRLSWR